ncbi:MFS general substrate transporter [Viridothelium virens]|uniref:MFS general substrate transporter n=1 Tax=Viridothelium virens TaxID=1048519 RepID=A0A6A6HBH1_VIRVR|nr:MFS general substrate transporter [Viridothelium virens]
MRLGYWDGPHDRDNPQNWPFGKKVFHSVVPAGMALVTTMAGSIYVPGHDDVMRTLGVSSEVAFLPYVFYTLGLAFGPMVSAPTSEAFGRKIIYRAGIPFFALFTLGAGFSQNIASLTVCRFFAGVFGSTGLAAGTPTLTDVWVPAERGIPMALYVTAPFLGPTLGPLIGGYVAQSKGWRWTQWVTLFFTIAFLMPVLFMSETYKKQILKRRARRQGRSVSGSKRTFLQATAFFMRATLTRPVHMMMVEPIVGLFSLYVALNFATIYNFYAAFPYVFSEAYDFDLGEIGLTFLGMGIGVLLASAGIVLIDRHFYRKRFQKARLRGEKLAPEHRLYIAMVGSILLPVSLFWFAWTARPGVHWISPIIAEVFFGAGILLVFMACLLYLADTYGPRYTASAMAANHLLRYTLGFVFPLFVLQMYKHLGTGWATSLLGFLNVAMTPIPWAFWFFGPKLRSMSKYQSE